MWKCCPKMITLKAAFLIKNISLRKWNSFIFIFFLEAFTTQIFWILGGKYLQLRKKNWLIENRMKTILMRSQEHGLMINFERISQRTFKLATRDVLNSNTLVAAAGGLQEILIACAIYFIGMFCALVIYIVEYFSKK